MTAVSGIFLNHVNGSIYLLRQQRKILEFVRPIERIMLWTPAGRDVVKTGLGLNSPKHFQPDSLRHLQTVVFKVFQHPEGLWRFHDSLFMTAGARLLLSADLGRRALMNSVAADSRDALCTPAGLQRSPDAGVGFLSSPVSSHKPETRTVV